MNLKRFHVSSSFTYYLAVTGQHARLVVRVGETVNVLVSLIAILSLLNYLEFSTCTVYHMFTSFQQETVFDVYFLHCTGEQKYTPVDLCVMC